MTARAAGALLLASVAASAAVSGRAPDMAPAASTADSKSQVPLPISDSMPSVRLPRAKQAVLDNGLRVMVLEGSGALPAFTAQLVFTDGGGLYEPAERRGLANFTAAMLREGTATRSSQEVARQLETLGATLATAAPLGSPTAKVTVSGLTPHLDRIFALLADVVRHPTFPQPEFARFASRAVAEVELTRSRPEFLAQEQFLRAIYGVHPAALAAPSPAAIRAMTREDLERFHATHYRPNGTLLVVIGAVTLDEILPKVKRLLGDWSRREIPQTALSAVSEPQGRSIRLVDRPASVQTVIHLGVLGITRNDPDYFPLLVMNEIVGGGSASRLFQNLRERNGYTYGVYSKLNAAKIPGVWQVTTSVRTEVTQGALKELLAELRRIREEPAQPGELENAKRALIGKYIFSLEQPESLLDNVITEALYNFPADYWDDYPQKVAAVSAEDIARVAKKMLDLEHLQIAAVGDGAKIRATLAEFGPVQSEADAPALPKQAAAGLSSGGR